jgi:diguanylate cyclase (GGDEF)-like protein
MVVAQFDYDEDSGFLTAEAFEFMFQNELKRAVRSQNYITLLTIDASWVGSAERRQLTRDVARLISRQVRDTDLLTHNDSGRLSVVLFDANLQNSLTVVDRLMSRFEKYEFSSPVTISVGAACCPTHGTDADQLRRVAEVEEVRRSRERCGGLSNAH